MPLPPLPPARVRVPRSERARSADQRRGLAVTGWLLASLLVVAGGCERSDRTASRPGSADRDQPATAATSSGKTESATTARSSAAVSDAGNASTQAAAASPTATAKQASQSPDQLVDAAQMQLSQQNFAAAQELLRSALIQSPQDARALFLSAHVAAAQGNLQEAISLLSEIPADHPQAGLAALGQAGDWLMMTEQWDQAKARFKQILDKLPDANMAHRRLGQLLNREGRRQQAAEHVRFLCRNGDISERELHSLLSIPDAFFDATGQHTNELEPIGALGEARIAFSQGRLGDARSTIESAAGERSLTPDESAFLGRVLAEQQATDAMPAWLQSVPPEAEQLGDYWMALGTWKFWERDFESAVTFFTEAVARVPTDRIAFNRMSDSLYQLGRDEPAKLARDRSDLLVQSKELATAIGSQVGANPDDVESLANVLDQLHRPFEAIMWRAVASSYRGNADSAVPALNQTRQALLANPPQPPDGWLLCGLERDSAAVSADLAELRGSDFKPERRVAGPALDAQPPQFANVAAAVGIDARFHNAVEQLESFTMMHHGIGGGVAVLDYDLDGRPDLYFPQGASEPDQWQGQLPNHLYRNLGERFESVTALASCDDRGFGQGVTSGDLNADGFPDLYIANIGVNRLLLNNGDGTFRDASELISQDDGTWTTSVAFSDVNGDHLADLVETNYVGDPAVFVEPPTVDPVTGERLRVLMPRPGDFRASPDWLHLSSGQDSLVSERLEVNAGDEFGDALGLIVTDVDGQVGNEIFVANDMRANHYWIRDRNQQNFAMIDTAIVSGLAYGGRGDANACMGVAAADLNADGLVDFAVTNFYKEPMNLFEQLSPGRFIDAAARFNLFELSYDVNGFGTQAFDYDNNGRTDLAVINGHIHDDSVNGVPFRMLPQLFDGTATSFTQVSVQDESAYWQTPSLGRALAKLDWNTDGRMDLVVTHLDLPHALLENRTESPGHWVQFELVGTTSERDAIGARVRVMAGQTEWVETVNSGDGFECKNEFVLAFGLGNVDRIDRVDVSWPSGEQQTFESIDVDQRWLLVEHESQPIALF